MPAGGAGAEIAFYGERVGGDVRGGGERAAEAGGFYFSGFIGIRRHFAWVRVESLCLDGRSMEEGYASEINRRGVGIPQYWNLLNIFSNECYMHWGVLRSILKTYLNTLEGNLMSYLILSIA